MPVYSHTYAASGHPIRLAATLSIRNQDETEPLFLSRIDYHDSAGARVHAYLNTTIKLAPLQSIELFIPSRDTRGGSGANFLVSWSSSSQCVQPLVQAVMVGTDGGRGYAFTTTGTTRDD